MFFKPKKTQNENVVNLLILLFIQTDMNLLSSVEHKILLSEQYPGWSFQYNERESGWMMSTIKVSMWQ